MMENTGFLISIVITFLYVSNGEPVININGCCSSQGVSVNCKEQNEMMLMNITRIFEEHKNRFETILWTLGSTFKTRDCQDIQRLGHTTTGIYTIYPEGTFGFSVRCEMDTSNGGWTVIQRRVSESDFFKTWNEYQIGFGNLSENFWLGNQQIHAISSQGWYELRVDLVSQSGEAAYAEYNVFKVDDVKSAYKLTVDGYSGNAGDSLKYHNGREFTTKDYDNDPHSVNCADVFLGAWWYGNCHHSNLNGKYGATENKGPRWSTFKDSEPMKETEMKIRRWRPSDTDLL